MSDHFGIACRAGGEIEQRGIVVGIGQCRTLEWRSGFDTCVEIEPAFGNFGADRYAVFQCGRIGYRTIDMTDDGFFADCNDHLYIGGIATVYDVFLGKQMGCRDTYCADFMQGDDREPEFVTAFEYKHDHVAPFYSQ